jgi:uncharacterized protein (UPF0332 family)
VNEFTGKRLKRAARSVAGAHRDLAAGDADLAAADAYYAMFYTAEALLASRDLTFSSHGAVHGAFGKEFAKTGELDSRYHRWLLAAFRERQEATYSLEPEITIDQATALIARAEEFLAAAQAYLTPSG